MRMTQVFGLPPAAYVFLDEHCKEEDCSPCPHCGKPTARKRVCGVYGSAAELGMFDDGPELLEYTLKDNTKVRETVQSSEWSSGPCIFLMLVDENGDTVISWDQKDIDRA